MNDKFKIYYHLLEEYKWDVESYEPYYHTHYARAVYESDIINSFRSAIDETHAIIAKSSIAVLNPVVNSTQVLTAFECKRVEIHTTDGKFISGGDTINENGSIVVKWSNDVPDKPVLAWCDPRGDRDRDQPLWVLSARYNSPMEEGA